MGLSNQKEEEDNDDRDLFLTSTVALEIYISLILIQDYIAK